MYQTSPILKGIKVVTKIIWKTDIEISECGRLVQHLYFPFIISNSFPLNTFTFSIFGNKFGAQC